MKYGLIVSVTIMVLVLSACSSGQSEKTSQQQTKDNQDYLSGMVDINKEAQKSIQDSVNKENNKLNNAMNETQNMPQYEDLTKKYTVAVLHTSAGDIKLKFDATNAPVTVNNFLNLAQSGFYNGIKFHRVIKGFMIQGGDPNTKTDNVATYGTGGPGYKFNDELKGTEKYLQGTLAMANAGPNTNGSQFFIVTASPEAPLPPSYTVFGKVVEGMDIALKIESVKTTGAPYDRPLEDVVIKSVDLLEK